RYPAWHEELEESQSVQPKSVDHDREEDQQRERNCNDNVARDREGIWNDAHHVEHEDEHEDGKYQRKKLHAFRTGGASQRARDEFIKHLGEGLQSARNERTRSSGAEHHQKDQSEADQHEQR